MNFISSYSSNLDWIVINPLLNQILFFTFNLSSIIHFNFILVFVLIYHFKFISLVYYCGIVVQFVGSSFEVQYFELSMYLLVVAVENIKILIDEGMIFEIHIIDFFQIGFRVRVISVGFIPVFLLILHWVYQLKQVMLLI